MDSRNRSGEFQMVVLIVSAKLADKAIQLFQKENVPIQYQFQANGTASSEIVAMLGLGNVGKTVFLSMMPKDFAWEVMEKLKKGLRLVRSNSGIVFSLPLSSSSNRLLKIMGKLPDNKKSMLPAIREKDVRRMADSKYALILVIVDQGFCDDVMEAARPSGALGGTVFNSRRLVNEETMKLWGISIHPEREIIAIVAEESNRLPIMKAVGEQCGVHSDAKGVLLSLPVDYAIGLE